MVKIKIQHFLYGKKSEKIKTLLVSHYLRLKRKFIACLTLAPLTNQGLARINIRTECTTENNQLGTEGG